MQLHAITAAVSWVLGDNHDGSPAAFAQLARAASPVAVAAMWQGAAVVLGLFLSLRLAPRVSAAHRFAAWAVGFAAVAALSFLPAMIHLYVGAVAPASTAASAIASGVAGVSPRAWLYIDSRWALAIAALWLAASAFRLAQFAFHTVRLRTLWRTATPIADSDITAEMKTELPRAVEICTTRELDRPSVIGFFAPRILIPDWLYARLTPQELRQIVLHEAEHLRRHDDWTNLIQKFVLVLFPLNPALAWIERRLCREREMACDEGVVQRTQSPRAYAACLASLAERGLQRAGERRAAVLSLAAWRRRPELVSRVHSILWRKPALQPMAARALLAVVGGGLLVGSVELARCPQMVAFVTAPAPRVSAQGDAVIRDQAALAMNANGFRMIPAKAILPEGRSAVAHLMAVPARRMANTPASEMAMRETASAAPHETLLKAEMPTANAEQSAQADAVLPDDNSNGQYIVLTTWEQVDAPAQPTREIADYDTDATNREGAATQQNAAQGQNAQKSAASVGTRITVTQLIFKVEPTSKVNQRGAATSTTNSMGSTGVTDGTTGATSIKPAAVSTYSGRRVAIPVANGWLVFQL
jgi:beta-lactamase regulating signal transducer with metallopeptidase domain